MIPDDGCIKVFNVTVQDDHERRQAVTVKHASHKRRKNYKCEENDKDVSYHTD